MDNYLKNLVDFYPKSSDQDAVLRLLQSAEQQCQKAGLKTTILTYNGVHNLYASTTGAKHVKVLLQSHVDVVPGDNQPFKASSDKYEGRGTFDMLFAAASYLKLIDELSGQLAKLDLGILLSGDEELGGDKGVEAFLHAGYTADVVILPDAGDGYDTLSVGAKGIFEITVRINGRSHHGSRPWEGDGAASKLMHFLNDAEQVFDTSSHDSSTMTVAKLAAGDVGNRGPAFADASLDIRYKDKADLARIKRELDNLLQKYNGQIIEALDGDDYQLDMSNPLASKFVTIHEKQLGKTVTRFTAPGSSDARFFAKYHTPVIMWRPDGGGAHGDKEWVSREGVEMFYQLLKEYVLSVA